MTPAALQQTVVSYAALALHDGGAEVTSEQIVTLLKATGHEVEPYWPMLFAGMIKSEGAVEAIFKSGKGGGGGGGAGGAGSGPGAGGAEEEKEEEKEEEEEEEIDMGGGMDMFGEEGGGDDY